MKEEKGGTKEPTARQTTDPVESQTFSPLVYDEINGD